MATRPVPLQQAFDTWLAHQRVAGRLRRGSSETVYRAMWQALVAWCLAQQPALRLADLHGARLLAYLASRHGLLAADGVLTPRYQQRLLSLVQRVQAHRAWLQQQATAGPAAALGMAATPQPNQRRPSLLMGPLHADMADPPLHLLPAQAQQLQAMLCQTQADTQATTQSDTNGRWQTQRDRCAAALQLGAGLGPGDVRALRLVDLQSTPTPHGAARHLLQVAANGSAPAHTAPLADWAAPVLQRWLATRTAQALGGPWLLPSTRSGKPWGKVAQYEAARRVLADAGLNPDGGGSFRLRHSFALRQLQQGHDPAQVAGWLGVADPQVMLRYQKVLAGWPGGAADRHTSTGAARPAAPAWPC